MSSIAIIGMACRYPEAASPRRLWENVMAQRRSFRRIPQARLRVEDYSSEHQADARISLRTAAVLEGYQFDRVRFHVSKETFVSTDMAHWLALDVAAQALEDAKLFENFGEFIGYMLDQLTLNHFNSCNILQDD